MPVSGRCVASVARFHKARVVAAGKWKDVPACSRTRGGGGEIWVSVNACLLAVKGFAPADGPAMCFFSLHIIRERGRDGNGDGQQGGFVADLQRNGMVPVNWSPTVQYRG